jgi:hypothetical protein
VTRFLGRHRATWLIAVGGAILLAGVGAFGTDHAPPLILYSYWLGMMVASALAVALIRDRLEARRELARRPILLAAALIAGVAATMTPVAWVVAAELLGGSRHPAKMAILFPQGLLIASAFVALQWALGRRGADAAPAPAAIRPPAVTDRLPASLRGAELHAIEAEDHYLRLHTDRGTALVLMRLSDAIEEAAGLDGARTHRSWWVARAAVVEAARGRGRAVPTLKSGVRVPVSRTHSPALRRAGWY